jgi:transposase InsO family protein
MISMPWKVLSKMDLKMQLIKSWNMGCFSVTDLSQKYSISRPTAHKWIGRYKRLGVNGFNEMSRAPKRCPHRTSKETLDVIILEKLKNRKRGPRKIRAQLKRQYPSLKLPAISTISYWLKKEGLVEDRRKRLRVPSYTQPFEKCQNPNEVWSVDYKGQFFTKNRKLCYPLTLSDNHSRYLLRCQALPGPQYIPTREVLKSAFCEYGLPIAIRSDNGTPFAGRCVGGLSRLSIWFIQLGITPERIQKGAPQENGRHERMHRTLKRDVISPPLDNLRQQQRAFDLFRYDYNNHRPHESLNDQTPNQHYKRSSQAYVEHPHKVEYDHGYTIRQVQIGGRIKFNAEEFYISKLLAGESVGLKEIAEDLWRVYYSFYPLGSIDTRRNVVLFN